MCDQTLVMSTGGAGDHADILPPTSARPNGTGSPPQHISRKSYGIKPLIHKNFNISCRRTDNTIVTSIAAIHPKSFASCGWISLHESYVTCPGQALSMLNCSTAHDSLAEWSKALAPGASPQGRGFEPHSCHFHHVLVCAVFGIVSMWKR